MATGPYVLMPAAPTVLRAAEEAIRANNLRRAHRILLTVVKQDPDNLRAWVLLGWTAPTPVAAGEYFQKALALDPDYAVAQDGLKWVRERLAREDEAIYVAAASTAIAMPRVNDADRYPASTGPRRLNSNLVVPLIDIALLILAESLTTLVAPQGGMYLYGVLLATLLIQASFTGRGPQQRLILSLALAPLIRMISLSLPLAPFPLVYWYLIIGMPLILAGFVTSRVTGYSLSKIGFTLRAVPVQILVGLTGFGLGFLEYWILRPAPLSTSLTWEAIWLPALILLVFTGFLEEFIFRGLMQRAASESLGRFGMVYVATLFAVLHLGYHSVLDVIFVFAAAIYFGFVVSRTSSILGVTLAHGITNIVLFLVYPFLF